MELLELNNLNRPLSQSHVKRIAEQILDGKWRYNADTIKITAKGEVVDGQHRLWAVIEAKMGIDTLIAYNVPASAFSTIDTIRKPRSGGDVLALSGVNRYRNVSAEAIKWLLRYQRKVLPDFRNPANRIENSDIEAALAENPNILGAVDRVHSLRGLVNPAVMGFVYYVIVNRDEDLADQMITTLRDPAGVALTHPFFQLRIYFANRHGGSKDPVMSIALCFKAANAAKRGERMKNLRWLRQGDRPEAFPTLII
jgi:hypothetical protein